MISSLFFFATVNAHIGRKRLPHVYTPWYTPCANLASSVCPGLLFASRPHLVLRRWGVFLPSDKIPPVIGHLIQLLGDPDFSNFWVNFSEEEGERKSERQRKKKRKEVREKGGKCLD